MKLAKTSPAAAVVHAVPRGRVLCGADATHDAKRGDGRPCLRCVQALERTYEPLPLADHWLWETWARVAQDVNANWGPYANPVLLSREERAEYEALFLETLDDAYHPANVRWARTLSDSKLMLEVERATQPA